MRKMMSIGASKAEKKQLLKKGGTLTATVVITLLVCGLFIVPWIKNDIRNELLYGEIALENTDTEMPHLIKKNRNM